MLDLPLPHTTRGWSPLPPPAYFSPFQIHGIVSVGSLGSMISPVLQGYPSWTCGRGLVIPQVPPTPMAVGTRGAASKRLASSTGTPNGDQPNILLLSRGIGAQCVCLVGGEKSTRCDTAESWDQRWPVAMWSHPPPMQKDQNNKVNGHVNIQFEVIANQLSLSLLCVGTLSGRCSRTRIKPPRTLRPGLFCDFVYFWGSRLHLLPPPLSTPLFSPLSPSFLGLSHRARCTLSWILGRIRSPFHSCLTLPFSGELPLSQVTIRASDYLP